ncbi:glycosyltransferase family 4 protein [Methanobacterium sp. MZD130B]|uniref:glycosyltransferase family 4 protein n=1 Tax=Methanobacterium sp. MZD130B TaxID=3394378 RepID=UPI0039FDB4FE
MEKVYSIRDFDDNLLVIDYPYPPKFKESYKFTINFIRIMESITENLYIISGNVSEKMIADKTHLHYVNIYPHLLSELKPLWVSKFVWTIKTLIIQLEICFGIIKFYKKSEIIIFFMMHPFTEVIPMMFAKVLKKKVLKVPFGLSPKEIIYAGYLFHLVEGFVLDLADYYIPEYETVASEIIKNDNLKHPSKLLSSAHFFILEDNFKIESKIESREKIIGYIGGFRKIKGIMNFLKALPTILDEIEDVKIYVIGDGILKGEVQRLIKQYNTERVILCDWIPHNKLPNILNKLKLIVIPSYSEGVPNIAIEAMACGTPVLSTCVGVIPLLIHQNDAGFILKDNSPSSISKEIIEIMSYDDDFLQDTVEKARQVIERDYLLNSTTKRWEKIFDFVRD